MKSLVGYCPETGINPPFFFQVVGYLNGIKLDYCIEIAEKQYQQEI